MDAQSTLILAVCGIFAAILGVMLIGAFMMYRLLRINVVNALMGWFMRGDDSRVPEDPYASQTVRRRADDLRARADALDFDKAVQQYQRTAPPDIAVTGTPQVAPTPPLEERPINPTSPIERGRRVSGGDSPTSVEFPPPPNRPLRKSRRDPNPDEVFGGMLDDDGDGTIDF